MHVPGFIILDLLSSYVLLSSKFYIFLASLLCILTSGQNLFTHVGHSLFLPLVKPGTDSIVFANSRHFVRSQFSLFQFTVTTQDVFVPFDQQYRWTHAFCLFSGDVLIHFTCYIQQVNQSSDIKSGHSYTSKSWFRSLYVQMTFHWRLL